MALSIQDVILLLERFFQPLLTNIVAALIVLLVGFILGRLAGKLIYKVLHELELNNLLKKALGVKVALEEVISGFINYFIYFIAVIMALDQLGLKTQILNILSAAVILLVVLSFFLSIKDFIPNVIAGIFLHQRGSLKEGHYVKFRDVQGRIIHINLVETKIETDDNDILFVPNSLLTKNGFIKLKEKKRAKRLKS